MADQACFSPQKAQQILDGAARVFAAAGFGGASMSRIAAEAGVSKGTLYNYFSGKQALFAAFVQRECTDHITLIFDDLPPQLPLEAALRLLGRRLLTMLLSDSGLLIYRMVVAEAAQFPGLAEAFHAAGPRRAIACMAGWIRAQVAAGLLDVADAEFAAEQLFALMQTRLLMRRRLGMLCPVEPAQIDQVVDQGVRLFMRGYATEAALAGHTGA